MAWPHEPPELLRGPRAGPFPGAPLLGELLDPGRQVLLVLLRGLQGPGQLRALPVQPGQFRRGLVHGGLHLDQAGHPGGAALGHARPEHVALGGDGHGLGAPGHQRLGLLQGSDDDVVPQHPFHGPHQGRVTVHQPGGRYGRRLRGDVDGGRDRSADRGRGRGAHGARRLGAHGSAAALSRLPGHAAVRLLAPARGARSARAVRGAARRPGPERARTLAGHRRGRDQEGGTAAVRVPQVADGPGRGPR